MRKYRTRIKDAAGAGDRLTSEQAGKLASAAEAAGVGEVEIGRHIGAVRAHQTNTARLKELESAIPAADAKRKELTDELRTLNDRANDVRFAIGETHRPSREESLLAEANRRLEFKHAKAGIFVAEASQ